MTDAPPTPARRFASILNGLWMAVDSRNLTGRLAAPLALIILHRLALIRQAFYRIADRLALGKMSPRKSGGPRPGRRPGTPNRLPSDPAWLIKLVPEAAASACQLRSLLTDPDPDVRIFACNILDSERNPDVEIWLIDVIEQDAHVNVCSTAVDLLCEVGTEKAIDPLVRLKVRFQSEPYIQFAAELALKRIREV